MSADTIQVVDSQYVSAAEDAQPASVLLSLVPMWSDSEYITEFLPQQRGRLERSAPPNFRKATNARQAMDLAYQLYKYLPLPADSLALFNLVDHLEGPCERTSASIVVAESRANP